MPGLTRRICAPGSRTWPRRPTTWARRMTAGMREKMRDMLASWGWNARIETFQVLYPTPLVERWSW